MYVFLFYVQKHDVGQMLFDLAFEHLGIIETQYFGLQITEDNSCSPVSICVCAIL